MKTTLKNAVLLALLAGALSACNSDDDSTPVKPTAVPTLAPTPTPTPLPTPVPTYYQTKAPYQPQQAANTYEAAPAGYSPVFTELLARHGSRGLSSLKYDLAIYNMWKKAADEGALTPLGQQLGPDVLKLMKANFLLGYGVNGISTPGYGNETQVGIKEHQQLAVRLQSRLAGFWKEVGDAAATKPRQIVTVTSGVDRAVDSGAFFVASLTKAQPNLATLIAYPPAPAPYPVAKPVAQKDGTNRFLLYFHKLAAKTDEVVSTTDPLYQTYQDSLAYQAYNTSDAEQLALQAAAVADPAVQAAGRTVLERLFAKAFIDKLGKTADYTFANAGSFTYASADGKFSSTLTGDGKTVIASAGDAGSLLYELYSIAPAMKDEAGVDFMPYLPAEQARVFAQVNDTADFYSKGPGMVEKGSVTWKMAQILQDDFFNEVDAIAKGNLAHAAKLRFAHAEITVPFASIMGLKNVLQQQPKSTTYSYANNPWRGDQVSPMAANMQWDVYSDGKGSLLVKMLYNEKETDFKTACDSAKLSPASHFYYYDKLKTCYGHVAAS